MDLNIRKKSVFENNNSLTISLAVRKKELVEKARKASGNMPTSLFNS